MGVAGSLANMFVECQFHILDTINIKSKVSNTVQNMNVAEQIKYVYNKEGLFGYARGFSACFYGSIFCGCVYFYLYKHVKMNQHKVFGDSLSPSMVVITASMIAEMFAVIIHFPYDMIKCRLQTKNSIFKYKNLPHAFTTEIQNNGIRSLYNGITPYVFTYVSFKVIQFTLYEYLFNY